jgi:hypothetical protein
MFSGEVTNNNFIVFGLTRSGFEPTIYRTRGEHANQYIIDAVSGCVFRDNVYEDDN